MQNPLGKMMQILGIVVVFLYLGIGTFLFFFAEKYNLPKNIKVIFGFFFIAYGLFRAARIWSKYRENNF
ncbi:MAG: hypothetical protein M0R21_00400 [Lentimicrobiaceae bacterium]|nr:hypothetical protein [Lentimicrobiaceae bacterium]